MKYASPYKLSAILGVSPYTTTEEQFAYDMGWDTPIFTEIQQKRMDAGKIYEDAILNMYELWSGTQVKDRQKKFFIDDLNFGGYIDGKDSNDIIIDAKNTDPENLKSNDYFLQMQGYLLGFEAQKAKLICPVERFKIKELVIERDNEFIDAVLIPALKWYKECMEKGEIIDLPLEVQLYRDMFNHNPKTTIKLSETDEDEIKQLINEYNSLDLSAKALEEEQKLIKERIKDIIGDGNVGVLSYPQIGSLSINTRTTKGKLDESLLSQQYPDIDLNKFKDEDKVSITMTIRKGKEK